MSVREGAATVARAFAKRTRRGLFAGKQPHFGDTVSEDGKNRTRRKWSPNTQNKRLYSETLQKMIPFTVTTAALRTIDKMGGLDNYLLKTPEHKLGSDVGMKWRQAILAARQQQAGKAGSFAASGLASN
uniref:Large ribosomal subunit protein bL28m n=1 Tax=Tetraselmis chuii TaxID=63592 RepID=A0A7S1X5A8_9CHLO|mmetsp:Transcript_33801/g.60382  ORF Transcript_33801/g.60382 Transcript_33801/m.60382 type:complete len:129 (+) Transcript_33801:124-510(+)|eukprot:CAMPEP_0177787602 /NCGR_PEP_ID=MMETSP0491_2-20121128/21600_1 /TAXON_ID=63592 /ORGANISM="Tetraselmis chuii, Strain PLY429" /LENGTH=128 /DNA_ID=CAMNT_0019309003 /DNA_START=80 /DNA_END=466 /DNA_ORIENTATION=+